MQWPKCNDCRVKVKTLWPSGPDVNVPARLTYNWCRVLEYLQGGLSMQILVNKHLRLNILPIMDPRWWLLIIKSSWWKLPGYIQRQSWFSPQMIRKRSVVSVKFGATLKTRTLLLEWQKSYILMSLVSASTWEVYILILRPLCKPSPMPTMSLTCKLRVVSTCTRLILVVAFLDLRI